MSKTRPWSPEAQRARAQRRQLAELVLQQQSDSDGHRQLVGAVVEQAVVDLRTGSQADIESAIQYFVEPAGEFAWHADGLGLNADAVRQRAQALLGERFGPDGAACGRGWPSWLGARSEGAAQPEHPEWIASDVCGVLGILNPRDALSEFAGNEKGVATTDTPGGPQDMLTVTEPGLNRLLGILNPRQALSEFTADEKGVTSVDTPGGPQDMFTVTERDAP